MKLITVRKRYRTYRKLYYMYTHIEHMMDQCFLIFLTLTIQYCTHTYTKSKSHNIKAIMRSDSVQLHLSSIFRWKIQRRKPRRTQFQLYMTVPDTFFKTKLKAAMMYIYNRFNLEKMHKTTTEQKDSLCFHLINEQSSFKAHFSVKIHQMGYTL